VSVHCPDNGLLALRASFFQIQFGGGILVKSLEDDEISHVIIPEPSDSSTLTPVFETRRARKRKFRVVSSNWVEESVLRGHLQDEVRYTIAPAVG